MKIYINASDVAACVGENRWKSPEDVVRMYWERNNLSPEKIASKGYVFDEQTTEKLVSKRGTVEDIRSLAEIQATALEHTEAVRCKKREHFACLDGTLRDFAVARADCVDLPGDVIQERLQVIKQSEDAAVALTKTRLDALDETLDEINDGKLMEEALVNKRVVERVMEKAVTAVTAAASNSSEKEGLDVLSGLVPAENLKTIADEARTYINTKRGTQGEDRIINDYEKASGEKVSKRNEKLYYITVGNVLIGGRIDGFVQKSNTLLEVKRRRNRFLGFPKYEKIQCEVYLRMLGLTSCTHVEEFDGRQKPREYTSNPELWKQVTSGLSAFEDLYATEVENFSRVH